MTAKCIDIYSYFQRNVLLLDFHNLKTRSLSDDLRTLVSLMSALFVWKFSSVSDILMSVQDQVAVEFHFSLVYIV